MSAAPEKITVDGAERDEPVTITCAKHDVEYRVDADAKITHCPGCGGRLRR
jgi:hypothetical protein